MNQLVELRLSLNVLDCGGDRLDPDSYVLIYSGEVWANHTEEGEDESELVQVGTVKFMVLDIEGALADDAWEAFDVFDGLKEASHYADVIDEDGYSEALIKVLDGEPFQRNVLILDMVVTFPKFRGRDYGLSAINAVLRRFKGGCGFALISVVPLQFGLAGPGTEKWEDWQLGMFGRDSRKCRAALFRHYKRAGFRRIPGSDHLMALPFDF